MNRQELLRSLPRVDDLLALASGRPGAGELPSPALLDASREVLDRLRSANQDDTGEELPGWEVLADCTVELARVQTAPRLKPVINATGVVLHTNLGRAVLAESVAEQIKRVAMDYSTLEYDPAQGARGSRHALVEGLLQRLTGCEAALVVNNNAAAVLLMLSALCAGKEVVVSRGELVEIGGSFRVPEIMAQGGALLREVGTTNKTRLSDYADAIGQELTGALLKVHTSNFRVVGFTEEVELSDLAALGKANGVPVLYDLGSGALLDLPAGLDEPTVAGSLAAGADLASFSGDKLLGGPQAGIVLGRRDLVERLKAHPLARALRVDKLTLAALEATLRLYLDLERAKEQIPTLGMLHCPPQQIKEKAASLLALIGERCPGLSVQLVETEGQVGGGSVPGQGLASWAVAVRPDHCSVDELERRLRTGEPTVVARIYKDRLLLDPRTVLPHQMNPLADAVGRCLSKEVTP